MEALLPVIALFCFYFALLTKVDANYVNFNNLDENADYLIRKSRNARRQGQGNLCHGGNRDLMGQLSSAVTSFSTRFYRTAVVDMSDAICSPYSLFQALAMTYLGARRRTASQMEQTMSLRRLGVCTHKAAHMAMTDMLASQSVILKIANRVYVRNGVHLTPSYSQNLQSNYESAITPLVWSVGVGPEVAINAWVSSKTGGLIPDLLPPGTISQDTALVLVNAIYFKGNWKKAFKESHTQNERFFKSHTQHITVPMMHMESKFQFANLQQEHAKVLMIPYTGDRFGMYIILPNRVDDLPTVEQALPTILNNRLDNLVSFSVRLSLPKFKLETSFDLQDTLERMGMVLPFSPRGADFSGMTGTKNLYISRVIHKAVVEVTETGTEAAGATAVVVTYGSFIQEWKDFRADHPFIFVIRDNVIKIPLFVGKYSGGS